MLEVLEQAATKDLVSLAQVQALPLYRPTMAAIAPIAISAVSLEVASWCRREFARQRYCETVPGYGDQWIVLSQPVESLVSVTVDGVAADLADIVVEDANGGVLNLEAGWPWRPRYAGRLQLTPIPDSEERNVSVVYWGKYRLADDPPEAEALPASVTLAVLDSVSRMLVEMGRDPALAGETRTLAGENAGGWAVNYSVSATTAAALAPAGLTPRAMALLKSFRR